MADQQDVRKLGGLINFLPFTYTAILIGSLSLMAVPWLTGFYSKDLIIELAYAQYQFSGQAAYWLGTLTAIFTSFYSFRLISLVFLSYPNAPKSDYLHTHVSPYALWRYNLNTKAEVTVRYPFAPLTVSLFRMGIFISPRLFASDASIPNKKRFHGGVKR